MSYVSSIKAVKLNEILLYKSDIDTKELKEFKNSDRKHLEDSDFINAKMFFNYLTDQVEILEWNEYKVELLNKNTQTFSPNEFLKKGNFGNEYFGTLYFKNYLGIANFRNNNIHVLSKKITDEELDSIIEFINDNITCIAFDFNQPVMSSIKRNSKKKSNQDYYMFLFIMNILRTKDKSLNFFTNFKIIENDPYRVFITNREYEDINSVNNIDDSTIMSIFENTDNLISCTNNTNKLAKRLSKGNNSYLPQNVLHERVNDSFDNPENRFIKFFITNSLMILEKFYMFFLNNKKTILNETLILETKTYIDKLKQILRYSYLNHVNDLVLIPMNSTVLTRKAGYKKIFSFYLGLKSVPENVFTEKDLNEVIENKSVDVIYELYCFFTLVHVLAEIYDVKLDNLKYSVVKSEHSQNLSKKNNANFIVFNEKPDLPKIKLHYNKTYSTPESYSKQFDPDISIEVFNNDEIKDIFFFDAKFKVNLKSDTSKFQDDDITKMHAYKDAIKLSSGAYVLYPGHLNKIFNETKGIFEIESGKLDIEYEINSENKNAVGALCLNANNSQNFHDIKNLIIKLIK